MNIWIIIYILWTNGNWNSSLSVVHIGFQHSLADITKIFGPIPWFNQKFKFWKRDSFFYQRKFHIIGPLYLKEFKLYALLYNAVNLKTIYKMHFDTLDYHHYCFIIYAYIIWYHWRSIYNHLALITMDSLDTLHYVFIFYYHSKIGEKHGKISIMYHATLDFIITDYIMSC